MCSNASLWWRLKRKKKSGHATAMVFVWCTVPVQSAETVFVPTSQFYIDVNIVTSFVAQLNERNKHPCCIFLRIFI